MKETRSRSWVKSITWRIIGIIILGFITWLITGNVEKTAIITFIFHTIRLILYVIHERIWNNIEWGYIKDE